MKLRFLATMAVIALAGSVIFAHGEKKHVIGTVETIKADSVVVKTADGKSVEVKLAPATVYVTRDGKTATASDLKAGDRVVIHATPKDGTLLADEVKFAAAKASPGVAKGKS
jgi:hypothetical protein